MKKHSYLNQKLQNIIFTTVLVLCFCFNAQAGIDLELTLTSPNASPGVFGNVTVIATVSNTGNETANNILLEFPTFPSDLPVTGDPVESQGFFSNWWTGTGTWDVGTLAPGASATVEIGLFPLAENIDFYGEVASANPSDADSTPGNGTSPTPNEDDEAVITINDTGGICEIDIIFTNNTCNDNGTPNNPDDDFMDITFTVDGENVGNSGYWISLTSIGQQMGGYGQTFTATPSIAVLNGFNDGMFTVVVTDIDDPSCTQTASVSASPPCSNSGNCQIDVVFSNVICDDNGTPNNPEDDWMRYDMLVTGQNTSSNYNVTYPISGGGIATGVGVYGQTASYAILLSEANNIHGGVLNLIVSDINGGCGGNYQVTAPLPCATNGSCSLSGVFSNIQCFDNGTLNNPNDDTWSFNLHVDAVNGGSSYFATINGQTFQGNYGAAEPYGLFDIADGNLNISVVDVDDPSCTESFFIAAPSPCSGVGNCTQVSEVSLAICNDNGTPNNPNDDTFDFTFTINGINSASTYIIDGDLPNPTTLDYGTEYTFTDYPVSGGDLNFTVTDFNDLSCNASFVIAAPGSCSGGALPDVELSLTSTDEAGAFNIVSYDLTITNAGNAPANGLLISTVLPDNAVPQGGNECSATGGTPQCFGGVAWSIATLAPGQTETLTFNLFTLDDQPLTAYAQVLQQNGQDADSAPDNGTPPIPNEDDEAAFTIGVGVPQFPDLTLSNFVENFPTTLQIGVEYPFTVDLNNIGEATASGNYRIGVYLSTNQTLDGNDFLAGEISTGNTPVGTLPNVSGILKVENNTPALNGYFVLLVADDLNEVTESNENNNTLVSNTTFSVAGGNGPCSGIFEATSQMELNQFNQSCITWEGAIVLSGNITDLSPLANLDHIAGNLTLDGTQVTSLNDLNELQSAGALFIYNNPELNTVSGLSANFSTPAIQIINNFNLGGIAGLPINNDLTDLTIANNPNLIFIDVLSGSLPNLGVTLGLLNNLTTLSDFNDVTQLKGLSISQLNSLTTLNGLENITAIENLSIASNSILDDCCAIFDLLNNGGVSGTTSIVNNEMGCNSVQDILDNCSTSGCQINPTVLDIQCQSNLTLTNGNDDTYTARILVEGSNDCFGNYKIDGELGGIFGSPAIFGQIATVGPFPISGGDVTITITDSNDEGAVQVTLNAPSSCSNGVDPNECGFENTYAINDAFFSAKFPYVEENANGYYLQNESSAINFEFSDLSIDLGGDQVSLITDQEFSNTFDRAEDGDFFTGEPVPLTGANNIALRKQTLDGAVVWSRTVTFDSGGPQSAPVFRDAITLSDGYAFLAAANGPQDIIWILKTDFDGNVIYNNQVMLTDGILTLEFDQLANNGDFIAYRQSSSRTMYLVRISANGNFLFEEGIVGDLVTSRFGGFDESPDGNFIFASYLEFPFPILEKLDAFTGERQWKIRLTDTFSPENDITFGSEADVVATSDGGAVVGYNRSSPVGVPSVFEYGKVNAIGNLVWWRELPSDYNLSAKLATSDNGILFAGTINGEYAVVKTTSEGLLTPTCVGGSNCNISAIVNISDCDDNGTPNNDLDDIFSYDITVTNSGGGTGFIIPGMCNLIGDGDYGVTYESGPVTINDFFNGANVCILADENDTDCTTTIQVVAPDPCSNGGGGNDPDLELNISSNSNFEQYGFANFDLTLTNAGAVAATGITVHIFGPDGGVWQGGNEGDADIGIFYPNGGGLSTWEIINLAAGETATLTVNVFVLDANAVTLSAEVDAQSPADADSTPNSYHPDNGAPVEDDEDQFTLSGSSPLVAQSDGSINTEGVILGKLFPNPTIHLLNIELESGEEDSAILQISNIQGAVIRQSDFYLEKGKTNIQMEVNNLPKGVYFLKIETENGVIVKRFLKH